jgi:hypothetical protein
MSWYNSSWDYRVKITIESDEVDSTLTDFPVYVDLSDLPSGFHTNCNQTDARDIRVTTSDGETEVPREVVFYDSSTDTGELHFKGTLSSSANTDFYIYYGNSSATEPASDSTYGRENVWNSGYEAVYHLQQTPTSAQVDSTSNGHNSTGYTGSMDSNDSVSAVLGKGLDFDGGDDDVVVDDTSQDFQVTNLTVSCWINSSGFSESGSWGIVSCGTVGTGGSWALGILSPSQALLGHWEGSDNKAYNANGTTDVVDGSDHFVYMINNGTTNKVYADGTEDGSISTSGKTVKTGSWDLEVGGWNASARSFQGIIDEIRISNVARSTDWMEAEYTNQNTPTTFYTIGTQEANATSENSERGVYIFGYQYSKEDSSSLKTDDATLSTTFDPTNYSNVATEDSTFDTISGDGYLNYLFKAYKSGGGSFLINVKAKSTKAPSSNTVYLQVYNRTTTSWENLDSDSSTSANTVFTLSGGKNSSLTDYYDSDNL